MVFAEGYFLIMLLQMVSLDITVSNNLLDFPEEEEKYYLHLSKVGVMMVESSNVRAELDQTLFYFLKNYP